MSNLAGKTFLRAKQEPQAPSHAVEEWSMRMATQMPGDVTAPRGTLRGHPQPWRTRPVPCDDGPLGMSCRPVPGATYSRTAALDAAKVAAGQKTKQGVSSSTAELSMGHWDARLGATNTGCGHRGSLTPNWSPLVQQDLTGTGSVNPGYWKPGTTKFRTPGTVTWDEMMSGVNAQHPAGTNSTANIARQEWETRLDAAGVGL